MKIKSIQIKPLFNNKTLMENNKLCNYVNPDMIHVVIDDRMEDS